MLNAWQPSQSGDSSWQEGFTNPINHQMWRGRWTKCLSQYTLEILTNKIVYPWGWHHGLFLLSTSLVLHWRSE